MSRNIRKDEWVARCERQSIELHQQEVELRKLRERPRWAKEPELAVVFALGMFTMFVISRFIL